MRPADLHALPEGARLVVVDMSGRLGWAAPPSGMVGTIVRHVQTHPQDGGACVVRWSDGARCVALAHEVEPAP